MRARRPTATVRWCIAAAICLAATGCGRRVALVPAAGRVTLDGKPVDCGAIMVQPRSGPAAQARINGDGSFRLGTFEPGDGAIPGPAAVRVVCRREISQPGTEKAYGPSLVPEKYASFETSGLTVDIEAGMQPLEIPLSTK